jgi:hypothetical protein
MSHGVMRSSYKLWLEEKKRKDNLGDLGIDVIMMIIKRKFNKKRT